MATKKTTNTNTKRTTRSKSTKKPTGKNVEHYEIKLLLLIGFTILSVFALHSDLIGPVGKFIQNIYLGLFSYGGFTIPYILLIAGFYKLNNRLVLYRNKTIVGLGLLFVSILLVVNILNFDTMSSKFIETEVSLLKLESIKTLYLDGIDLTGAGIIGGLIGKLFINLVNITGLYIIVGTLWVISFVLITNIKVTEVVKNFFVHTKNSYKENKEIRQKAKEEYLKESEKLEVQRQKEFEKIKKQKEKETNDRSQEKLDKALERVDKKLKLEEKEHQKKLEEYDAMFSQSPTRSLVDKIFKKADVPTKDELKAYHANKLKKKEFEDELETKFSQYDTKGYAFDENFEQDQIVDQAPDIFDNHIEVDPKDMGIEITGFGTIVEESIKKAYEEAEVVNEPVPEPEMPETVMVNMAPEKKERVSSFDAAFSRAEKMKEDNSIHVKEDFYEGNPMSEEERKNVDKFDQITGSAPAKNVEESKIPDEVIERHMNESVRLEFENYQVPPITLLKKNMTLNTENKQAIYEKAKRLEEILANFKIDAQVIQISRGPAITRYEIELKPGTKMSKITNLSDDIALNLATQQVRIAAVPGKAAVGIEVPNDSTSLVTLREVLDSNEFSTSKGKLSVGLGKNIAGKPIVADLSKMPHMLIAGATGSGKSVCVNTLITSILLNSKPDEVKFLMIDPKVVELNNYNGIPHLILPVVTDPKKASVALNWAVQEMTKRYNEFAENSVRDISGFNKKFGHDKDRFMPQIVVIIDELADLMMVAPNQVEDAICRLAQMARAAGIHLIVATQRPSVDVITGVIKANIPSRIAFAVSSAIDSRTIIDMAGAEKLLGKGDMLYYPVGSSKPQRVQGAFIGDDEVEEIVEAVKTQFDAFKYDEKILDKVSHTSQSSDSGDDEDDEYFSQAVRLVIEMEQASISMLQRRFKIGYNRAARLVDTMEERGIVGPSQGSKPREVLIGPSEIN